MTKLVAPIKRIEQYLYALCVMDFNNIPIPRSRLEFFAHGLITGVLPEFQAETREEEYMVAIITGDYANLPLPKSRADQLLYKICLGETEIRDIELETRYEMLLAYIAEHSNVSLETVLVECVNALQTILNTVEVPVKRAILKGNTLFNLMTKCKDEYVVMYNDINNPNNTVANISMMKPNTEYTLFYKAKYRTEGDGAGTAGGLKIATSIEQGFIFTSQSYTTEYMKYVYRFTTSSVVDCFVFASTVSYFAIKECILLEGDHTNVDIPYFEGMQSVKNSQTLVNLLNVYEDGHYYSSLVGETDFVTFFNMNDKKVYFDTAYENGSYKTSFIVEPHSIYTMQFSPQEKFRLINLVEAHGWTSENYAECKVVMVKGDYTNVDIPYFEGMQSVKMPSLTTTGKNLFDKTKTIFDKVINLDTGIISNDSLTNITDFIKVIPNTQYTMSFNSTTSMWTRCFGFTEPKHGKYITDANGVRNNCYFDSDSRTITFTTSPTTNYLIFLFGKGVEETFQLEEGSTATTYEPYKSNILTVNEEVELRGIGNVQDTLDCLTGELTQAVYEYTFTGDEGWEISGGNNGGYSFFAFDSAWLPIKFDDTKETNIPISCDKLPTITHSDFDDRLKKVGINLSYFFRLNFEDCNSNDGATVEDLKAYLKANPTTVQYPISKSVKTVDLTITDQDGNAVPCLSTFNDATHISINAVDIIPQVDLEVRVDANTMANVASQQDDLAVAQASLSDAIDAQNDDIEMTQNALDEVKGEQHE